MHILHIFHARLGPGAISVHPEVCGYTVQTFMDNFLHECIAGLDDKMQSHFQAAYPSSKMSFWVPESILQAAVPDMVRRFKGTQPAVPMYPPVCYFASRLYICALS